MTKARAEWLLANASPFGELPYSFNKYGANPIEPQGITEAEDKYINMIWSLMDPRTSYYDALVMIKEELGTDA